MYDTIHIREIRADDTEKVNAFFDAMGPESSAFFNRFHGNQNYLLQYMGAPGKDKRFWMAEENGEMLGYVFCFEWDTSIPWLGIAVREDQKGHHLGRRLIAYAQQQVREAGKGGLQLTTHQANLRGQILYETMGFRRIGTHGASGEVYYLFAFRPESSGS